MKIRINSYKDCDYFRRECLFIDGKQVVSVGPLCECPEDAIIGRDLVSCYDILHYMKLAHQAGTNNQPLEIEETSDEDIY